MPRLTEELVRAARDLPRPVSPPVSPPGILNFNVYNAVEDSKTSAELERLNALAVEGGWLEALHNVYGHDSNLVRYVTDSRRASFLDLLPISPEDDVLEIGPGLGQFTPLLARLAKSVSCLEVVEGQARFVAERCRQSGVNNVAVACGGDDCRLPYGDAKFDLVVLNLVFEWCGNREPNRTHEEMQARLLGEIYRVLKLGGSVFLTTKNRFALRYLLGGHDEHVHHFRFGSALPRWLVRGVSKLLGKRRPAGHLHSWHGLAGLLRAQGFEITRSFWAAPEMRYPERLVDADACSIRKARAKADFRQGDTRLTNFIMRWMPAALAPHVAPGLAFLARRND